MPVLEAYWVGKCSVQPNLLIIRDVSKDGLERLSQRLASDSPARCKRTAG